MKLKTSMVKMLLRKIAIDDEDEDQSGKDEAKEDSIRALKDKDETMHAKANATEDSIRKFEHEDEEIYAKNDISRIKGDI